MQNGRLISRDTELEAPEGFKVVLVFGTITVPNDTPIGDNRIIGVNDELKLDVSQHENLEEKYVLFDAPDVCKAVLGLDSMRDPKTIAEIDEVLSLISQGQPAHPKAQAQRDKLAKYRDSLPTGDSMRLVLKSMVQVLDERAPKKEAQ